MNVLNQPVLTLNAAWQCLSPKTVKEAIVAMMGGEGGHNPPAMGIDMEFSLNPDGTVNWSDMIYANPVKWSDWVKLPVREDQNDEAIRTGGGKIIRAPRVIIQPNFNKMPVVSPKPTKDAIIRRDGGVCFIENTQVLVSNVKSKNIQDIKIGESVVDYRGNLQKVMHTFTRKYSGDLYTIKSVGETPNVATAEHPFFCLCKDKYSTLGVIDSSKLQGINLSDIQIKLAKNLTDSDMLIRPLPIQPHGKRDSMNIDVAKYVSTTHTIKSNFIYSYHKKKSARYIKFVASDFYIIGLFASEGYYSKSSLVFCLHKKEIELKDKIELFATRWGATVTIKYQKNSNGMYVKVSNVNWLSDVFRSFIGEYSHSKRLSDELLAALTPELSIAIVRGACDGDACKYHDKLHKINRTSLWTISSKLANQYKNICYSIGIYPSSSEVIRKNRKYAQYVLHFCGTCNEKLIGNPITEAARTNKRYFSTITGVEYIITPITKVSHVSVADIMVYNLEIDNTNSYIANNVAVHNCQYTNKKLTRAQGNIDHVIPRHHGGKNTFENMVWCEKGLNSMKANRRNEEIGLKLIRKPKAPPATPLSATITEARHPAWKPFMHKHQ